MKINFNNIEKAFLTMKESGWDVSKNKKWQFFFFSNDLVILKDLGIILSNEGYNIEYIGKVDDSSEYELILSKIEILKPIELNNKNIFFNDIALKKKIEYDGWDVENI